MLKVEVLPAGHGDCLWIEYGDPGSSRCLLIDGGAQGTYKRALRPKLERLRELELLVVTHVDADHITGVLELLADESSEFRSKDIWFNGYRHLPDEAPDTLGPVQGEKFTDFLVRPEIGWNVATNQGPIVVPPDDILPRMELEGGLILTLLSPLPSGLAALKPKWENEVTKAGLDPNRARAEEVAVSEEFALLDATPPDIAALAEAPFVEDDSEANGSSIAFVLEFEGHQVLMAGDAHPQVLRTSIDRMRGGKPLKLSACKLPHHGSKANVSRQLLETLDCDLYIFSTNGAHFRHPDREAVARVIRFGAESPTLAFNYRSDYSSIWDNGRLQDQYTYKVRFPDRPPEGTILVFQ